jgi:hypothetical protein
MDQLRMRRHNLYQRCKVDNIALPLRTEGGAEEEGTTTALLLPLFRSSLSMRDAHRVLCILFPCFLQRRLRSAWSSPARRWSWPLRTFVR